MSLIVVEAVTPVLLALACVVIGVGFLGLVSWAFGTPK